MNAIQFFAPALALPFLSTGAILLLGTIWIGRQDRKLASDYLRGAGITLTAFIVALILFWFWSWSLEQRANPAVAGVIFVGIYVAALALAIRVGTRRGQPSGMGQRFTIGIIAALLTAMVTSFRFVESLNACVVGQSVFLAMSCG